MRMRKIIGHSKRLFSLEKRKKEYLDVSIGTCISLVITLFLFRGFIFSKGFAWGFGEFGINIGARDYIFYLWNPLTQQPKVVPHMLIDILRYMLPLEGAQRLPIILSFTLMGTSMFLAVYMLLPADFGRFERFLSALFGGVFYMVNPFTTTRIPHGKIFFLYALIPLLFYFAYTTVEGLSELDHRDIIRKAIVTSLILFVMSISVRFLYLIPMIIAIPTVQYRIILKDYKKFGLYVLSTSILFVGLSCVWILPTFVPSGGISSPSHYILTDQVLHLLSRHGSVLNVLTFNSHWHGKARELLLLSNPNLNLIRSVTLYLIPLFATLPLIMFRKSRVVHSLSIYALVSIFLAKGTNPPISQFYEWFVFVSPLSTFGWMFRGAVKWAFLALTPSFILLSSFSVAWILRKIMGFRLNKQIIVRKFDLHTAKLVISIALFLIMLTIPLFSGAPLLTGDVEEKMSTENIPTEYEELNNWLDPKDGSKIFWYPSIPDWGAKGSSISYNFYLNYLIDEGFRSKRLDAVYLLSQLGVQYFVVQKNDATSEMIISILEDQGANFIKSFGDLKVYELTDRSGTVYVNNKVIVADDFAQLATTSQLVGHGTRLAFVFPYNPTWMKTQGTDIVFVSDSDVSILSHIPALFIAPFEETYKGQPNEVWSRARTDDPLHGSWHSYLQSRGIVNWDFDYGKGLVFTWAPFILEEPPSLKAEDLISRFNFEDKNLGNFSVNAKNVQSLFLSEDAYEGAYGLKAELNNSTWGWKTISSPLVPANYGGQYKWQCYVKGENVDRAHVKITEYDKNKKIVTGQRMATIGSDDFNWKKVSFNFAPTSSETAFMQLQIWHGHETKQPLPNNVWIDEVKVYDLKDYLKPNTLEMAFTVQTTATYDLYIRYFQNRDGGKIAITLEGNQIEIINTKDEISSFTWKKVGTYNLNRGTHTLTLENREGFNAVNLFTLVTEEEIAELEETVRSLLQNKRIIYILEAEADMYRENSSVSNKYGGEASNGEILELTLLSRVWNELDIVKPGNYTILIRSKGNLGIKVDEREYTVNSTQFDWTYLGPISLEKGKCEIEIIPLLTHYSQWNFEKGKLEEWQTNVPKIQTLSLDQKAYAGNCSLKAELNASTWGWKVLQSPMIPVSPVNTYKWDFYVAGENAHKVHAKIFEYDINNKSIAGYRMAGIGTGNFTYENINFEYRPHQNASYMQLQIWHGSNTDQPLPNRVWIDNVKVYGYQTSDLDVIWLYSTQKENETLEDIFTPNEIPAEVIYYQKINPTKYIVEVNATKPFMLSFAEAYDPSWIAYINGERIEPIPLYSVINGFWINQTGQLEITIEYEPQKWFYYGSIISVTTLLACLTYLTYNRTKNKPIWKRTKRIIARIRLILHLNRRKKNIERRKV